jgi:ribosomal protein S3AE
MAKEQQAAKTKQTKVKKKHWVPIYAPKSFNSIPLGETLVDEAAKVASKSVTTSLMALTDDPRRQGYNVRFDVTDVKDGKAHTQVIAMIMTPGTIKRLIRRHRDKVSDSFVMRIAGGRTVRIKPLLVTKTKASKSAQTQIRSTTRGLLRESFQKMRFEDVVLDIVDGKPQRQLRDVCSKTHPVRSADIREIIVLPENRAMTKEMHDLTEQEASEDEARKAQLASAAAAASADEGAPVSSERPRRRAKKEDDTEAAEGDE